MTGNGPPGLHVSEKYTFAALTRASALGGFLLTNTTTECPCTEPSWVIEKSKPSPNDGLADNQKPGPDKSWVASPVTEK